MKSKTADIFYAFCISQGGLCIALMYSADIVSLAITLVLSVGVSLFCSLAVKKRPSRSIQKITSVGALISSSVSVYIGCSLACDYALNKSFLPLCVFLFVTAAVYLAYSRLRAVKSVASVISVLAVILLLVILLLCIIENDFSKTCVDRGDKKILFPLCVFSAIDLIYVAAHVRRQNRCMFVIGTAFAPIYTLITAVIAVCTLTPDIYYSLKAPIITLWQSCYVVSFVDRFETVIICVLFAVSLIKSAILLKPVVKNHPKKIIILFALLPVFLFLYPPLIYVYAALSLALSAPYLFNTLLKK